ncbi:MAG: tetratricopeptide (TPR) repeat protein [Myxococcota bacterium]
MTDARTSVGAGYAVVVLVVAVVGIVLPRERPVPKPDFTLERWRPESKRLDPILERDVTLAAKHSLQDVPEDVIGAFEALGLAEVATGGRLENAEYEAATEKAVTRLTEHYFTVGEEAYRALGVHMSQAFVHAVLGVLAASNVAGQPVKAWLRDHPEDPVAIRARALGGTFIENAVGWGLITHDNKLAGDNPSLIRIHFKVRWFRFITTVKDYTFLMDLEELRALWLWRLEGDRNLGMAQRLRVGKWIRGLEPDYPIYATMGSLFARRGQTDKAIAYFREALLDDPFNKTIANNLEFLLRTRSP